MGFNKCGYRSLNIKFWQVRVSSVVIHHCHFYCFKNELQNKTVSKDAVILVSTFLFIIFLLGRLKKKVLTKVEDLTLEVVTF